MGVVRFMPFVFTLSLRYRFFDKSLRKEFLNQLNPIYLRLSACASTAGTGVVNIFSKL
jgi:hypothetical protein